MEKVKQKIKEYNQAALELFNEKGKYDYVKLSDLVSATDEDINNLEKLIGITIPSQLKDLYKKIGRIKNEEEDESHCFEIKEPKRLIADTTKSFSETYSDRKLSFGLIDSIIKYWGFDRPEFQNYGEYDNGLTEEETNYINDNYKCYGHWINDDTIEGVYFLFFDKNGNFGEFYYHQDEFDEAAIELKELINDGITETKSLEDIIANALEVAKNTMIEWN